MADLVDLQHQISAAEQPGDFLIAKLAVRQHGVVAHRQLEELGLGRWAISYRVAAGRLHTLYRQVYAVGHWRVTACGRWMAAVLACGEGALLSHRSAMALLGLGSTAASRVDVTAVCRGRRQTAGIALHQVRSLDPQDRTTVNAIPVTNVARTLLDLAEVLPRRRLERAFEEADRRELVDLTAISRLLERSPGGVASSPYVPCSLSATGP